MRAVIIVIICAIIGIGIWMGTGGSSSTSSSNSNVAQNTGNTGSSNTGQNQDMAITDTSSADTDQESYNDEGELSDDLDDFEDDIKPATVLYSSAEDAIAAIKKGSVDYDDLVLEQFSELGDNCSWCDDFYVEVNELMLATDTDEDAKSYYAEIMAISGRVDNVSNLISAIKNAEDDDSADLYAEALEVAIGDDKLVSFLGENLTGDSELLQESVVAAITNHGTRTAIDLLYQHTVDQGDPDGYYSVGVGLGEVIPEEESLPYLGELMNKRDKYSHLSVKALLNYGDEGLKMVIDSLEASTNKDFDKEMLEDAIDHISIEDNTESILKDCARSSASAVAKELCKGSLDDYEIDFEG